MTVGVVVGGVVRRLGQVTGNGSANFTIAWSVANGTTISLTAIPIGQNARFTSTGLSVSPGQMIDFRIAPVLRRLILPTKTRARIYDKNGYLLIDSRNLFIPGDVLRFELPAPDASKPGFFRRNWQAFRTWLGRGDLPLYREYGSEAGKDYPEVTDALAGRNASMVRV